VTCGYAPLERIWRIGLFRISGTLTDLFRSTLYEDAHNDISVSGSDDLTNKEVELANGIMTCKFRRKLSTGDSKDKVIAIGEKIRVCSFQSTTTYMKKHSTKSFCFYWLVIDNFNG
jgi:hypothetical protein